MHSALIIHAYSPVHAIDTSFTQFIPVDLQSQPVEIPCRVRLDGREIYILAPLQRFQDEIKEHEDEILVKVFGLLNIRNSRFAVCDELLF